MNRFLLLSAGLLATLGSCKSKCPPPAEDNRVAVAVCGVIERQHGNAEKMRGLAIAAYLTAADELEMGRKWSSGEVTSENRVGKYSTAERRGWQNAYAGATWCRAAEMIHDQLIVNAQLHDDADLAKLMATRNDRDCSLDVFSRLFVDDLAAAKKFVDDALELNQDKARLELALIERCKQAFPAKPQ